LRVCRLCLVKINTRADIHKKDNFAFLPQTFSVTKSTK
jgi:hypothetical protein